MLLEYSSGGIDIPFGMDQSILDIDCGSISASRRLRLFVASPIAIRTDVRFASGQTRKSRPCGGMFVLLPCLLWPSSISALAPLQTTQQLGPFRSRCRRRQERSALA